MSEVRFCTIPSGDQAFVLRKTQNQEMKNRLLSILWMSAMFGCSGTHEEQITEKDVRQILANWKEVMVTKDTVLFESILHDDFFYAGSDDGKLTSKVTMMDNLANDQSRMLAPEYYDVHIRYFGDIAVVRAREKLMFPGDHDTTVLHLRFTDIYQKKNGRVTTLSTHSSPIAQ